jgi:uncharacterized protein (TIGR03435 family)
MTKRAGHKLSGLSAFLFTLLALLSEASPLTNAAVSDLIQTNEFEVASIKQSLVPAGRMSIQLEPDGGIRMEGVTARQLIETAYDVHNFQIENLPKDLTEVRYDIQAKANDPIKVDPRNVNDAQMKSIEAWRTRGNERLQALLAQRFDLKLRRESKDRPIYVLLTNKAHTNLLPAQSVTDLTESGTHISDGTLTAKSTTMESFAILLSQQLDRVVVDKTGLAGRYSFSLTWNPTELKAIATAGADSGTEPPTVASDEKRPSLFTALQQLGLKLTSQKGQVQILVIDHIEKPSPN